MEKSKLSISIPGKSLKIDMARQDAEFWFSTLVGVLLEQQEINEEKDPEESKNIMEKQEPDEKPSDDAAQVMESAETVQHKSVIDLKKSSTSLVEKKAYKGFLHIRCEVCGKFKEFCIKNPITKSKCICGEYTPLIDLSEMYANCGVCGHTWKYLTNNVEPMDEIMCLECGAPITMEKDKHGNYRTINREVG